MQKRGMMATLMRSQHIFCKAGCTTFDDGLAVEFWEIEQSRSVNRFVWTIVCQSCCPLSPALSAAFYMQCQALCSLAGRQFSFLSVSFSEFYNVTLQRLQNLGKLDGNSRMIRGLEWVNGSIRGCSIFTYTHICVYACTNTCVLCVHTFFQMGFPYLQKNG